MATITKRCSVLAYGKEPTMSSPHTLKGSGSVTVLNVCLEAGVLVYFLQTVHFLSTSVIHCLRLGHQTIPFRVR